MTPESMWKQYIKEQHISTEIPYSSWNYGEDADNLAQLSLTGEKTATCSAHITYAIEGEKLPKQGDYSIITNKNHSAVCIIQITKVYTTLFSHVTEEHAKKEGDGSLSNWRRIHKAFFTQELQQYGLQFSEEMEVLCEEFTLIHPKKSKN